VLVVVEVAMKVIPLICHFIFFQK